MRRISTNSEFEKAVGYSRAVVDEHYVHVSGTIGFDYETMAISDDVIEQAHHHTRGKMTCVVDSSQAMATNLDDVCNAASHRTRHRRR